MKSLLTIGACLSIAASTQAFFTSNKRQTTKKLLTIPLTRTVHEKTLTATQQVIREDKIKRLQAAIEKEEQVYGIPILGEESDQIIPLRNQFNLAYSGPVYFGNPLQTDKLISRFIYDTGSGVLTTTSTDCTNCDDPFMYYDSDASVTFSQASTTRNKLEYGSATLQGYYVTD